MFKRKPLTLAMATVLGVASLTSIYTGSVLAQDQDQNAEEELLIEEVVVTGSRIVRKELVSAQPVEVLDSAAIDATGLNNVGDILMNITASDGTGLRPITTATNGSDGSQEISLRNLGADRTLILVDGRRWVTDTDQTVDLNTIPVAMIERIEILKDGASAIYGSDAIAGVINVITKKDFEGVQFDIYYGETSKGDGAQENYALTMGANGDRSNAVFSISYTARTKFSPVIARFPMFLIMVVRNPGSHSCAVLRSLNTLVFGISVWFSYRARMVRIPTTTKAGRTRGVITLRRSTTCNSRSNATTCSPAHNMN